MPPCITQRQCQHQAAFACASPTPSLSRIEKRKADEPSYTYIAKVRCCHSHLAWLLLSYCKIVPVIGAFINFLTSISVLAAVLPPVWRARRAPGGRGGHMESLLTLTVFSTRVGFAEPLGTGVEHEGLILTAGGGRGGSPSLAGSGRLKRQRVLCLDVVLARRPAAAEVT